MERQESRRVLLVEDEPATRSLLARHLRRSGLEVLAVDSGEAALVAARRAPAGYDVVVSDVHLPGMSGLDLTSLILSRTPSQPVVLITGDPDAALAREALSRGPVSYLLKPFEMFELDAAVKQALVRQDMTRGWGPLGESITPGAVPQGWLDLVDERSYAGPGHAQRVGKLALALAEASPEHGMQVDTGELLVAAWSHELGRLAREAADPVVMATEGARMLQGLGCAPGVVEGVCHQYERWDGSGGPLGLAGSAIPLLSQLLSVADALDHYIAAWLQTGRDGTLAAERALGLIQAQRGTMFSPAVVDAAVRQRLRVLAICGQRTGPGSGEMVAELALSGAEAA
jgi:putative two-component system response regulator